MKQYVIHIYKSLFKGFGQIMLQANIFTGLLFFAAILYDSTIMALGGVIANLVAIMTAKILGYHKHNIEQGLYGFNASLIGISTLFYFEPSPGVWFVIVFASILSTLMMRYSLERDLPAYTFPFVLASWGIIFFLSIPAFGFKAVPTHFEQVKEMDDILVQGHAFGKVVFNGSPMAGLIFFVGVFISSPIKALYAFAAVVISIYISHSLDAPEELIQQGVFSFNAVLCGIAMGGDNIRDGIYVLISIFIATVVDIYLIDWGVTTLTFPFVLSMWFMFPIKRIDNWFAKTIRLFT
ncbi:urea transporter [Myroides sp. LJL116]